MKSLLAMATGLVFSGCATAKAPETSSTAAALALGTSLVVLAAGVQVLDGDDVGGRNYGSWFRLDADPSGSTIAGMKISADRFDLNAVTSGDSYFVYLYNDDPSVPVVVLDQSTAEGAGPENWIATHTGEDVTLHPGEWMQVVSDVTFVSDAEFNTIVFRHGWHEVIDRGLLGVRDESSPARSIGTAWQPSLTRPTLVVASMSATCALTLAGGEAGHVDLLVGPTDPPSRVIGSVPCGNTGAVVIGVSLEQTSGGAVPWIVTPGSFVKVVSTDTAGTPSYTLAVTEAQL